MDESKAWQVISLKASIAETNIQNYALNLFNKIRIFHSEMSFINF